MKRTCDYSICTGCMGCMEICPTKCISFESKELGHLYPRIDTSKCIDCKKCERVCPAINSQKFKYPEKAYAAIHTCNQTYKKSTSGGSATAFAEKAIDEGLIVYGCASLPLGEIKHIRVDNKNDLYKLQGSKYVQSSISDILPLLKKDLLNNSKVLFIGTPCQCAAIRNIFCNSLDNILTIELICHGVPSIEFLKEYLLKNKINLIDIKRISFRTEDGFQIKVYDNNDKTIYQSVSYFQKPDYDIYYSTFMNGFSYRKSCYTCKFARSKRASDITIGDFWGLGIMESTSEIPPHKHGISLVLPITEKGKDFINKCDNINLYSRPVEEAIQGNSQLRFPTPYTWRTRVFNLLRHMIGISLAFKISVLDRRIKGYIKKITKGKRQ